MRIPTHELRETIIIEDYAGQGARGATYGSPRTTVGAVQSSGRLVRDSKGNEVTVDSLVLIRPESGPVPAESRLTWFGQHYRVVAATAQPDTRRPSHWELQIARWAG